MGDYSIITYLFYIYIFVYRNFFKHVVFSISFPASAHLRNFVKVLLVIFFHVEYHLKPTLSNILLYELS